MRSGWRTLNDKPIPDIQEFVRLACLDGQVVHIGTDSLQTGRYTQFATVIAVLTPGKGGRAAYRRRAVKRINSLRERLKEEVWDSVSLAMELGPVIKGELSVHIDANPSERYMSNKYVQELVGLVVGQGFKALIKPDSWAASHVGDHIVRTLGKLPRRMVA